MKSFTTAVLALAAFCCASAAPAQDGTYVGVSYGLVTYQEDGLPTVRPQFLAFKAGRDLHPNIAVEVRAGFGVGDDTVNVAGTPVDFKIDHYAGVFGKGILPLADAFSVYGLVGLVAGKVTARGFGYSASSSDTSFSVGLGIDLAFSRHSVVNVEWSELFQGTGYKVEAASLGYTYMY